MWKILHTILRKFGIVKVDDRTWHCVELHVRPDGFQLYIDGEAVRPLGRTNWFYRAYMRF